MPVSFAEFIGSVGVLLLLAGFFLNLFGLIEHTSRSYQSMNAIGAGLSCYASYLIGFVPFMVLEGTWSAVAVVALVRGRIAPDSR